MFAVLMFAVLTVNQSFTGSCFSFPPRSLSSMLERHWIQRSTLTLRSAEEMKCFSMAFNSSSLFKASFLLGEEMRGKKGGVQGKPGGR